MSTTTISSQLAESSEREQFTQLAVETAKLAKWSAQLVSMVREGADPKLMKRMGNDLKDQALKVRGLTQLL